MKLRSSGGVVVVRVALVTAAMVLSTSCQAGFLTYSQWESLDTFARNMYMAGAFDSLIEFDADRGANHFSDCIASTKMTTGPLANNVLSFARANPEYQRRSPQFALINYLIKLCGKAPAGTQ